MPEESPSLSAVSDHDGRSLTIIRLLYFFFLGTMALISGFLTIYYREIGLTGAQIGAVSAIPPVVALISGPIWGMVNDRFGRIRLLLLLIATGMSLAMLGLLNTRAYLLIMLMIGLYEFFNRPVETLLGGAVLRILGSRSEYYARQRMWGFVGFLVVSALSGFILEATGVRALFYGVIGLLVIFALISQWLPPQPATVMNTPIHTGLGILMRKRGWVVFTVATIVLGIPTSGMLIYLNPYVIELGGSIGMVGLMGSLGGLSGLPIMFYGPRLIQRFGARKLFAAAFFIYSLRFLLYGLMPNPVWALTISLMHGLSAVMYFISGVDLANRLAPEDLKATGQGLFHGAYALAGIIGAWAGGIFIDAFGGARLFQAYAGLALLGWLVLVVGYHWADGQTQQEQGTATA